MNIDLARVISSSSTAVDFLSLVELKTEFSFLRTGVELTVELAVFEFDNDEVGLSFN